MPETSGLLGVNANCDCPGEKSNKSNSCSAPQNVSNQHQSGCLSGEEHDGRPCEAGRKAAWESRERDGQVAHAPWRCGTTKRCTRLPQPLDSAALSWENPNPARSGRGASDWPSLGHMPMAQLPGRWSWRISYPLTQEQALYPPMSHLGDPPMGRGVRCWAAPP